MAIRAYFQSCASIINVKSGLSSPSIGFKNLILRKNQPLVLLKQAPGSMLQFHTSGKARDVFNVQDEEDFKARVLSSRKPIVVDFHAKWCGPCKVLMPRLETAIAATKGEVDLAKVDIDDNPDIAMTYNVGAVPSVLGIKNGEVTEKFVGLKDEDQIDTFIANLTKK